MRSLGGCEVDAPWTADCVVRLTGAGGTSDGDWSTMRSLGSLEFDGAVNDDGG